jgi:hypothetical protein
MESLEETIIFVLTKLRPPFNKKIHNGSFKVQRARNSHKAAYTMVHCHAFPFYNMIGPYR